MKNAPAQTASEGALDSRHYISNPAAARRPPPRVANVKADDASSDRAPMRFRLMSAGEVVKAPPLRWLVRNVLPAEGLAALYGASGSGKSFLALDLCAAVAGGTNWFAAPVHRVPVVYIALEGEAGLPQRLLAWQRHHGRTLPDDLHIVMQRLDLRKENDVTELAEAVMAAGGAGGLLIIDTLNRAASGADENSSSDMGRIIDAAKGLQTKLGGLVVLVHHLGKDASRGLRGHSSLYAALDAAIEVTRTDGQRSWRIAKAKDGDDSAVHHFRLDSVAVDGSGEGHTSCVVVPADAAARPVRPKAPKGGNQRIVYDALRDLLRKASDRGKGGAPASIACVELDAAVLAIAPRLTCDDKRKPERTRQAITSLIASKFVEHRDGWVWQS